MMEDNRRVTINTIICTSCQPLIVNDVDGGYMSLIYQTDCECNPEQETHTIKPMSNTIPNTLHPVKAGCARRMSAGRAGRWMAGQDAWPEARRGRGEAADATVDGGEVPLPTARKFSKMRSLNHVL